MSNKTATSNSTPANVYLNEFNILMDDIAYLPYVSGLLCAHAKTFDAISTHYNFTPFLYYRDVPERILEQYHNPAVAAFSVYMWNEQLSLRIAEMVKERYPDCLIVFGGAQVPFSPAGYFAEHPFIDVAIRGEGEQAFADILIQAIDSKQFHQIDGISWRDPATGQCMINPNDRPVPKDLDKYPSPYLDGVYEYLFTPDSPLTYQAILETNRGCPFNCAYCFWGKGGLSVKFGFHSLDRIEAEIKWCAEHKIRYVFNADSNFGMHPRDYQIAQCFADTKSKYGYPEKLRTCFGKNSDDRIFDIAALMVEHKLEKGITISRQSNNEEVLRNVGRSNIKMSTFDNLQRRFNQINVPVYSELILALPGETYQSWVNGVEEHLQAGLKSQLFIYLCEVYPNTQLADPDYIKKFGIKIQRILLTEIHGSLRKPNEVPEAQDVIIATDSMPHGQWRKAAKFSFIAMLLHSMKLGFFILKFLCDRYQLKYTDLITYISENKMPPGLGPMFRTEMQHYDRQIDNLLCGGGRGRVLPRYGTLNWDEEEAAFLRISENLEQFYQEFQQLLEGFLDHHDVTYSQDELHEVVQYQEIRIPTQSAPVVTEMDFSQNLPEYFEFCLNPDPVPLRPQPQQITISPADYHDDPKLYARDVILWGRKAGNMLAECNWKNLQPVCK